MPGIFLGIALIIFSLVLYLLDVNMRSGWNYLSLILMSVGLYWSMITIRDKTLGGYINYKQAFMAGFWTGLVAIIISTIFTYVQVTVIDPGFAQEVLDQAIEQALERNPDMSDAELEQVESITSMFTSPAMITVWGLVGSLFFTVILSLIIAIFAKREKPVDFAEEGVTEE
jgi:hypothetical protein